MSDLEPQLRTEPTSAPSLKLTVVDPVAGDGPSEGWKLSVGERINAPSSRESGRLGGILALVAAISLVGAGAGYMMIMSGSSAPIPPATPVISDLAPAKSEAPSPLVAAASPPPQAAPAQPIETGSLQLQSPKDSVDAAPQPLAATPPAALAAAEPVAPPPPTPAVVPTITNAAPLAVPPVAAPASVQPVVQPRVPPAKSVAAPTPPPVKPQVTSAPAASAPKKTPGTDVQKIARADLPPPSGLRTSPLPPAAPAKPGLAAAAGPLPPVTDRQVPPPLRPVSADSRDPLQMRAAAVGLHPQLPPELLAALSPEDFHNAGIAIRTAVAETPEGTVFVWPRQPWPEQATFKVRVVRSANPDCHRYVVTVVKEGWSTTSAPMETCDVPVTRRY